MPQNISVRRFWTEYETVQERKPRANPLVPGEPVGEPQQVPVDWIEYATRFNDQGQPTATTVDRVRAIDPANLKFDPNIGGGEKEMYFNSRWELVQPAYEAWKEGRDTPVNGTPLDLWPGLTTAQAEVFRLAGLRSVEDIRNMDQSSASRVNLPNIMDFQKKAALFLDNTDVAAAAAREAAKDQRLADMERMFAEQSERMEAMQAMLAERLTPVADEVEELRTRLDAAGIEYDKRWGAPRLRELLNEQAA